MSTRLQVSDGDRHLSRDDLTPLSGVTILLVDDQQVLRSAVGRLLAAAGASVREAADADRAIEIATVERVDLLLTDVEMPGRDGAAVALALALVAIQPWVVVVFMSGTPHETHAARHRLDATACFIEKPFAPRALLDTLTTTLAFAREPATHRCEPAR